MLPELHDRAMAFEHPRRLAAMSIDIQLPPQPHVLPIRAHRTLLRRVGRCATFAVGLTLVTALFLGYLHKLPASDWTFYYEITRLAAQDRYPFIDYWMEYPPVFPLSIAAA